MACQTEHALGDQAVIAVPDPRHWHGPEARLIQRASAGSGHNHQSGQKQSRCHFAAVLDAGAGW
jgi:hypothetical protein